MQTQFSLAYPDSPKKEWIIKESDDAFTATEEFNGILEAWAGYRGLASKIRRFLKKYPWHFDAMCHYALCKQDEGKVIEAFAFAHAAVAQAENSFPTEFEEEHHLIPGGYIENRPFLRCLVNLMVIQSEVGELSESIATGFRVLSFDPEDRMGARLELPKSLIRAGQNRKAVDLFENPMYEGSFYATIYLYPVALLNLGREAEARLAIEDCLTKPRIAKYILNPDLPRPEPEKIPFLGMTSGSEIEGYHYAAQFRRFWREGGKAFELLRESSREAESQGWPAFMSGK
ncbi:MAG: hypothetical protein KDN05_17385 [Verrucomicrobiae bacterium]|nr:hypothetical protein [Verrucomicrobiae bacterium]